MTFSKEVKKELSEINNLNNKELDLYELYGYSLTNQSKKFLTESKYNINRYSKLLSNIGVNDFKISINGSNFEIETKENLEKIINEKLNIIKNNNEEKIDKEKCENKKTQNVDINNDYKEKSKEEKQEIQKAIIRGAFLGSGTITDPKRNYHLEIHFKDEKSLKICSEILNDNNIKCYEIIKKESNTEYNKDIKEKNKKNIKKKSKNNTLYIEEGESISKFLAFIGATKSVLQFEDTRVIKEIRNNVNRELNLESANLNKTIGSSVRQINYIKLIKKKNKFNELTEKEQKLAEIRLKNPDSSLEELRKMLGEDISKSGVSHRMEKIEKIGKALEKSDKNKK